MKYEELKSYLIQSFQKGLPGQFVQFEMASYHRITKPIEIPKNAKDSAVTIVIYPVAEHWHFTLIQRPFYNGPHSGQIALPGGKWELSDQNLQATAIRETFEEIGIQLQYNELIGQLTELYIPVSNIKVQPFVAILDAQPIFKLETNEVVEILECTISDLLRQSNKLITEVVINENLKIKTPYFSFQNKIVWGATAMILNEFKKVWEDALT